MAHVMSREELAAWVASQPSVYDLTELTGRKKNEESTTFVLTFEVGRRSLMVALISGTVVGLPVAAVLSWILSVFGLGEFLYLVFLGPLLAGAIGIWLFVGRQSRGMRLTRYRGLLDKRKAKAANGKLYVGLVEVEEPVLSVMIPVVIDTPPTMIPGAIAPVIPAATPLTRKGARA
ncbi:hypothetical protein [Microbacterium enclense]|uniref:hypothetical protein n=1 Tax=Microbacterium enclense TaxID=993073 RepID=UPI003F819501